MRGLISIDEFYCPAFEQVLDARRLAAIVSFPGHARGSNLLRWRIRWCHEQCRRSEIPT